jgi:hypothetical protein
MITNIGSTANLKGESTDVKPITGIAQNTLFLELDTEELYYWNGMEWKVVGDNA